MARLRTACPDSPGPARGYLSDLGRTDVVGRPSDRQRAYYAKLRRAEEAVIKAIRPLRKNMLFNIELYHRDGEGQGYFVEETAHAPSAARPGRPTR